MALASADFENLLNDLVAKLERAAQEKPFKSASEFEMRIRTMINDMGGYQGMQVDLKPHPHVFPDIPLGVNGIEVKFTEKDTWRSVANSVFESTRDVTVENIFVIFGKMGGALPQVKWAPYEECVMHVRTSHVPRFELEIGASEPIFEKFGISYSEFQKLDLHEKMEHIRAYARGRLKQGERLWWLEDTTDSEHSLPIQARLYTSLTDLEKIELRAEGVLLCPQIVSGSRQRHKYDDFVLYALTYRGILCHQARDLFSAGSVAGKERGGNYVQRSLMDIQCTILKAALSLEDALFVEYWGFSCPPKQRISKWLEMADKHCKDWKPSECMFVNEE